MHKIFAALTTLAITAVSLGVSLSPATAATTAGYRLTPVTAAQAGTFVVGETLWKCSAEGCSAREASGRPAIVCAQAARSIGKVSSFNAQGAEFDAVALAKCNAKAK